MWQRLDSFYHGDQFSAIMSSEKTHKNTSKKSSEDKIEEFVETQLSCLKLEEAAENRKKSFRHVLTGLATRTGFDEDVGSLVFLNIVSSNAKFNPDFVICSM